MASKSKTKGKGYEREIAKHLSLIFELNFERTPGSGAFTGGQNAFRANILSEEQLIIFDGDILPPKELGRFKFECKCRKEIPYHLLLSSWSELDNWIEQAKSREKWWFLIFKANRKGSCIAFDEKVKYNLRHPVLYYKHCAITSMDGFFEDNKDIILGQNEIDPTPFL